MKSDGIFDVVLANFESDQEDDMGKKGGGVHSSHSLASSAFSLRVLLSLRSQISPPIIHPSMS